MFESLFETIAGGMNMSVEQADFIKSLWAPRQLRKGEFFERIGDITTHGGFVVRGCFRTYAINASGLESIIHFSPERAFIGDITSAVTGQPTLYTVDAIEPSTTLTIDLDSFNRMLERFPDIARLQAWPAAVSGCTAAADRDIVERLGGRTIRGLRRAAAGPCGTRPSTNAGLVPWDYT